MAMSWCAFGVRVYGNPKLGDAQWMSTFRAFINDFNDFVVALDKGKLDRAACERMRTKFHRLEMND